MGRGRPEGQMAEDLLDHCGLFDEGDDAHGACASRTHERIHLGHLWLPDDLAQEATRSDLKRKLS